MPTKKDKDNTESTGPLTDTLKDKMKEIAKKFETDKKLNQEQKKVIEDIISNTKE